MRNKATILLIGSLIGVPLLLWYGYYSAFHTVFKIRGDLIDENGKPLDAVVMVSEGQFVSITQETDRSHSEQIRNGNIDIKTVPCDVVGLVFHSDGYAEQHVSYSHMRDVPNPLHIVLHAAKVTSATSKRYVAGKYLLRNIDQSLYGAYLTVSLDLNADGTATTITCLPDGITKITHTGAWSESGDKMTRRITVIVSGRSGVQDPAKLSAQPLVLRPADDGRLMLDRGGADFKPQ